METNWFVVRLLLALALMMFAPSCSPDSDDDDQADDDAVTDDDADDDAVIDDDADDDAVIDDDADDDVDDDLDDDADDDLDDDSDDDVDDDADDDVDDDSDDDADDDADDDLVGDLELIDGGGFSGTGIAADPTRSGVVNVMTVSADSLLLYTVAGTSVTKETLADFVESFRLVGDDDGAMHVIYRSRIDLVLHYLTNESGVWTDEELEDSTEIWAFDLAVDADGTPHVCMAGDGLMLRERSAKGWTAETVAEILPSSCALAVGEEGYVHILAADESANPIVARYYTNWSGSWVSRAIQSYSYSPLWGWAGFDSLDVAVDETGMPQFAHHAWVAGLEIVDFYLAHAAFDNGNVVRWSDNGDSDLDRLELALDDGGHALIFGGGHALRLWTNASGDWVETVLADPAASGVSVQQNGTDGYLVAYVDEDSSTLRAGVLSDDGWTSAELDQAAEASAGSLVVDELGVSHVAYIDQATMTVMLADDTGGEWLAEKVGSLPEECDPEYAGLALALDPAGGSRILYQCLDGETAAVLATRTELGWTYESPFAATVTITGMAVDGDGYNHIGYADGNSVYYANDRSGEWQAELVATAEELWSYTLSVDADGNAHAIYADSRDWVFYVVYATNASGDWVFEELSSGDTFGGFSSLVFDSDWQPHLLLVSQEEEDKTCWNRLRHYWRADDAWSSEIAYQVEMDNDTSIGGGALALGDDGTVHISFCARCWMDPEIWYATNRSGSWTTAPLFPYAAGEYDYIGSDIEIDGTGQVRVVFEIGGALWQALVPPAQ